ncbi:MAG TPA: hypothetical protein VIY29_08040, partial [Ktedonobacteraceae bacterium]
HEMEQKPEADQQQREQERGRLVSGFHREHRHERQWNEQKKEARGRQIIVQVCAQADDAPPEKRQQPGPDG